MRETGLLTFCIKQQGQMQRDSPLRALCFPTPTDTGPTPLSSGQLPRHTQPGWRAVGPAPGGNSAHHAVFGCVLPQRLSGVHPPIPCPSCLVRVAAVSCWDNWHQPLNWPPYLSVGLY